MTNYLWQLNDRTNEEISVLDWIDIAHCARQRACAAAGQADGRFGREYNTVRLISGIAAKY